MPEHNVYIRQLPRVELQNKDMEVSIYSDQEKHGTLTISRGGIGWLAKGFKMERLLSWEEFDGMMRKEFGDRKKKRRK